MNAVTTGIVAGAAGITTLNTVTYLDLPRGPVRPLAPSRARCATTSLSPTRQ